MKIFSKLVASVLLLFGMATGHAVSQTDVPSAETDPVLIFNKVCYSQLPELRDIRDMAIGMAWEAMGGEDLKRFTQVENPAVLEGWDVRIDKRIYRLGIIQNPAEGKLAENYPDFAEGTITGCTLVLDGSDDADIVLERMNLLARKDPVSEKVAEGDLFTTTWAGGNEDFKVFLFYKSDAENKANMINVTILSKEKP